MGVDGNIGGYRRMLWGSRVVVNHRGRGELVWPKLITDNNKDELLSYTVGS